MNELFLMVKNIVAQPTILKFDNGLSGSIKRISKK